MKALHLDMKEKFGFKYILTHRTNQDCLENFFSQLRGRNGPNDHPTPVECLNNIKHIILGKNPGLSKHLHSNTIEREVEEYVSATFNVILSREGTNVDEEFTENNANDQSDDLPHSTLNDELEELDDAFLEDFSIATTENFLETNSDDEDLDIDEVSKDSSAVEEVELLEKNLQG